MRRILAIAAAFSLTFTMVSEVARIEEDSPLWNCRTMGNQVCGTPDGFLVYYRDGKPWSVSTPVNGRPMCGTDSQCEQYASWG